MNRKQKNIKLFILASLLLIVLLMFLVGCGSQQADDVDMDSTMEEMCPAGFHDCRAMTDRELVVWFYTIDCLIDIGLITEGQVNTENLVPPLVREEDGFFFCGKDENGDPQLAAGCAHPSLNLIRIISFDAARLEEEGLSELIYCHEDGHIILFKLVLDITHDSIFYTNAQLCLTPSLDLF